MSGLRLVRIHKERAPGVYGGGCFEVTAEGQHDSGRAFLVRITATAEVSDRGDRSWWPESIRVVRGARSREVRATHMDAEIAEDLNRFWTEDRFYFHLDI